VHPIPRPELLDADRVTSADRDDMTLLEHRTRAQQLDEALRASCAYATQLWQHLDAVRGYLYESLPSDPRAPGPNPHIGASPTGPDDDEGWQRWIDTYATVTSILCGAHGDSGFGLDEARHAARDRREAPNLTVLARAHGPAETTEVSDAGAPPPGTAPAADTRTSASVLRAAGLGLLTALALRGLRPRRSTP
jgi:hypothetical protein